MADVFPTGDKFDVFISYRRKDSAALAKLIENQLEKYDINVFLDVTDIQETGDFSDHLQMAIETADFFVCLLGAETLDSQWVLNEIEYACQHNKILIPVLQESFVQSDNYPPSVQLLLKQQGVNVLDKRGLYIEQAIESLAKLIKPQAVSSPARAVSVQGHGVVHSRNRERMLQSVRNYWIDGVLENSLHGAALIELGLEHSAEKVANPWDTILRIHEDNERSLRSDESIVDVFSQTQGKLLVLGEPGGGKTTTMLHLTRVLLERAEKDLAQPIPAVFNLSSWAEKRRSLAEWLVDELNEKYNAPRKVAQQWIEDDALLLLLDGLDEVELSVRNACVEAINAFRQEHGFVDIIVCSRTQDYEALSKKLQLGGAVVIQPLADYQVDAYLSGLGSAMDTLRQLLNEDSHMKTLAQTPLMLSIMALAFQNVNIKDVKHYESLEEQRSYIFDLYIARMFKRRGDNQYYSPELTQHYLEWLAREQVGHQQTLFHIEDLQETYLPDNWQRAAYRFLHRTFAGLGIGGFMGVLSGVLVIFGARLLQTPGFFLPSWQTNFVLIMYLILFCMLIGSAIGAVLFIPAAALDAALIQAQLKPRSLRRFLATLLVLAMIGAVIGCVSAGSLYSIVGDSLEDFLNRIGVPLIAFATGVGAYCVCYAFLLGRVPHLRRWMHYSLAYSLGYMIFWILITFMMDFGYLLWTQVSILLSICVLGIGIVMGAVLLALYGDRVTSAERLGWNWSWRWMSIASLLVIVLMIPIDVGSRWTTFTDFLKLESNVLTQKFYPDYFDSVGNLQHWRLAIDATKSLVLQSDLLLMVLILLTAMMGGGVIGGLSKQESIEQRTKPNQGIRRSIAAALKTSLGFGLAGVLISGIPAIALYAISSPNIYYGDIIQTSALWVLIGLMMGMALGLLFAGTDTIIKHSLLRWMLWHDGTIPWNYSHFLGYAADRIFLRQVGGGFIYVHRYLLEHFARRNTTQAWLTQRLQRRRLLTTTIFVMLPIFYLVVALLVYSCNNAIAAMQDRFDDAPPDNALEPIPVGACEMELGVPYHVPSGSLACNYVVNQAGTWLSIEIIPDSSTVDMGRLRFTSAATNENLLDSNMYNYTRDHYYDVLIHEAGLYEVFVDVNPNYDSSYSILVNLLPMDDLVLGYNAGHFCRNDCNSRFEAQAGDFVLLQYNSIELSTMQILDSTYKDVNPYCLSDDDCPGQIVTINYFRVELTPNIYSGTQLCSGEHYIHDTWGGTILPISMTGWHYVSLGQPYSSYKGSMSYDSLQLQVLDPIPAQIGANSGSISEAAPAQVWHYTGGAGERLIISTDANWDTQLSLFNPSYEYLLHNDDAGEIAPVPLCIWDDGTHYYPDDFIMPTTLTSRLEATLEESGSYYIVVSSFENMTHGDYILTIDSSQRRGTQSR